MQPGIALQPLEHEESMSMKEISSYHMPFGHGPRSCVGRNLAMGEMSVFIAELVRGYDMQVHQIPEVVILPNTVPDFLP